MIIYDPKGKMREMLEDLRIDLGIPADDAEDDPKGLGLTSTWSASHHATHTSSQRANRRVQYDAQQLSFTAKPNLHSKASPPQQRRTVSPGGKPPLPVPRPDSSGGLKAPASPTTQSDAGGDAKQMREASVDVLTISHDDTAPDDFINSDTLLNSTLKGANSTANSGDEQDQAALYEKHLANTLDDADSATLSDSEMSLRNQPSISVDDIERSKPSSGERNTAKKTVTSAHGANDLNQTNEIMAKPTPRERRRKGIETKDSTRSQEKGNTTSDTIDVSELDDDDYDTF